MSKNVSLNQVTDFQQQRKLHISPLNSCIIQNDFIQTNGYNYKPLTNSYICNLQPNSYTCNSQLNSNEITLQTPNSAKIACSSPMQNDAVKFSEEHVNGRMLTPAVLQQIIAEDVRHPKNNKLIEKDLDSRNTVVKRTPDGAVQITYRKMFNTLPVQNKNSVYILPKPVPQTTKLVPQIIRRESNNTLTSNIVCTSVNNAGIHNDRICVNPSLVTIAKLPVNSSLNSKNTIQSKPTAQNETPHVIQSNNRNGNSNNLTINLPKIINKHNSANSQHSSSSFLNSTDIDFHSVTNNNTAVNINVSEDSHMHSTFSNQYDTSLATERLLPSSELMNFDNLDLELNTLNVDSLDSISMTTFLQSDLSLLNTTNTNSLINNTTCEFDPNAIQTNNHTFITKNIESEVMVVESNENCFQILESVDAIVKQNLHVDASSFDGSFNNDIVTLNNFTETFTNELIDIIDVSPEMSTTAGCNKIILIGSWNAKNARYFCKFGTCIVDAELIQNGVLRCYSPIHKAGKVTLCVLCDKDIISKDVDFEFVNPTESMDETSVKHEDWMSISDEYLIKTLEERITSVAEIMGVEDLLNSNEIVNENNFEERLIEICKQLMTMKVDFKFDYNVENTMTVLHLAAALGYLKLIQLLLNWVESNPNKIIMVEACPVRFDQFRLLPIMWSAANGHFNTTCVLHQWHESAIEECDACGCTVIDLARECGHGTLVEYLERLLKKSTMSRENSIVQEQNNAAMPPSVNTQSRAIDIAEASSSRTLGKTLAHIQSLISEGDENNLDDLSSDEDESLFEVSPFTPRQRSVTDDSKPSTSFSQLSPASPGQTALQSPFNRQTRETAEFCEFFYKAKKIEKDFAELTLTGEEQTDLYRAANVIQTAFKSYKDRRQRRDQELSAATLIQSYYRRYKQYAAFKKMQKGAVLIQSQYRAHREKEKRKYQAASVIQNYYRRYRERKLGCTQKEFQLKNRLQQQADRKTNRYLMQTTARFSRELPETFLMSDTRGASGCETDAFLMSDTHDG